MRWDSLTEKKRSLDELRPLPLELVSNLGNWFKVELTYTSNTLEGNTLARQETAAVVEKGLTIGGKSLVEHLEATNHAAALGKVVQITQSESAQMTERPVCHRRDYARRPPAWRSLRLGKRDACAMRRRWRRCRRIRGSG